MTRTPRTLPLRPTLLALALASAFAPAMAEDAKSTQDKLIEAGIDAGVAYVSGSAADRALASQYSGIPRDSHFGLLLDFDYSLRDPAKNAWVQVDGRGLGGDMRELAGVWKRPGEWAVGASYSETVRREPLTVNRPSGTENLETKRTGVGFNASKTLTQDLAVELSLRHEKKEGSRFFGQGFTCPAPQAPGCAPPSAIATGGAVLLLPEPIDSTHTEAEARATWMHGGLRIALGYYGSWYRNSLSALQPAVPSSLYNPAGTLLPLVTGLQAILNQPIALAPDNQAHQLDLTGTYEFAPTTRLNFRVAYGRATQNEDFAANGLTGAPPGVTSLDGDVVTTLVRLGLSSRPVPRLGLNATLRYEERDDRTPVAFYGVEGTDTFTNRRLPYRKLKGTAEAQYQFTGDWRGSVGADYESIDRGAFTPTAAAGGITALRQDTHEAGVYAEVRRRLGSSVSGALRVTSRKRDGSNWLQDNSGRGVTEVEDSALPSNAILMPTLADRRQEKAKLSVDWQPSDELSVQVGAEEGLDRYDQLRGYGLDRTRMGAYSVDATYAVNSKWNLTGFASYGRQALNQAKPLGYVMALRDRGWGFGAGVTGKPMAKVEVGANLSYFEDRSSYAQALDPLAGQDSATLLAATGGLPDITYAQTALRVYGQYTLDAKSSLRLDVLWQRYRWNDWAWGYNGVPFAYSDGTTVGLKPRQDVAFIALTYRYDFR